MRFGLRGRILLLTVLTPLTLGVATLVLVQRNVREHVDASSIHESLAHSESVFESMLATRSRALGGGAQVIVQDPRFFSLLMLGATQRDYRFVATVRGMAHDFSRITETDVFEVYDRQGRVLASVGDTKTSKAARDSLVRLALRGRPVEGVLVEQDAHYQVALAPAFADGRIVGVLMLGTKIGDSLAKELRAMMRCEVTFLSDRVVTGTTLTSQADRYALLQTLGTLDLSPRADLRRLGVLRVEGAHETHLTIVRRIPIADPSLRQFYVLQRSFDPETMFQQRMQKDLLLLAALAVLIAIVTGWMFSEEIIRPVRSLVRGAQEMESGNYDHPIVVRRGDELGYLATSFVEMRRRERGYIESLERAARLKGDFIRIASQELRSPISGLAGYRELMAEGELGPTTPQQQKALESMKDCLARLTRVADDATQAGQIQGERLQLDRRDHELGTLLRRAVGEALAGGARRDVRIETHADPADAQVNVDGELIPQAFAQLIAHTVRGTRGDGTVRVDVRIDHGRLLATIQDQASAPGASAGSPIHPDALGLGVSIARGILEAHGGTLQAEAHDEHATGFVVELPLDPAARAAA